MKGWSYMVGVLLMVTAVMAAQAVEGDGEVEIRGRINDHALVISNSQRRQIHQMLQQHNFASGQYIAVVTVADSGEQSATTLAEQLWQQWHSNRKDKAVLLLLVKAQKSAAIVAGEVLRPKLDQATTTRILEGELASSLLRDDFDSAAMEGVKGIIAELNH